MRHLLLPVFAAAIFTFQACGAKADNSQQDKDMTQNTESQAPDADTRDVDLLISTSKGDIAVRLYGDTPLHRDNFLKLAREGYYDGTLFHRVIRDFMIQGGDPDSKNAPAGKMLGEGDPGYTIPAEFVYPKHFHRRGALAAARTSDQVNPERRSSGSQFYIVTGQVFNDSTLTQLERQMQMGKAQEIFNSLVAAHRDEIMQLRRDRNQAALQTLQGQLAEQAEREAASNAPRFNAEQRRAYTTEGGTPHLDGQYTVFGEVTSGMEVVDAIQQAATDRNDRPADDIRILSITVRE